MKPRPEEEDSPFVEEAQLRGYDVWKTRAPEDENPEPYDWHAAGQFPCSPKSGCTLCFPPGKP